jgi:thiol-disulfide isomerase/thioredoxin
MPRLWKYLKVGLLSVTLLLAGCGGGNPVEPAPTTDTQLAPEFSYRDAAGNDVSLSDLRGQVVLLNFWATWCPPCVYEMPFLEEAHQQMPENTIILAVNVGENADTVSAFLTEHGLTLPVILDRSGAIAQLYRAFQMPTSVIIDADGIINQYKVGPFSGTAEILDRLERAAAP